MYEQAEIGSTKITCQFGKINGEIEYVKLYEEANYITRFCYYIK